MYILCTFLHIIVHIVYNVKRIGKKMEIGNKLKDLRKNYNITQSKLADFYDISLDEIFDRQR